MKNRIRGGITTKRKRQPNGANNHQTHVVYIERPSINGDTSNWIMWGTGISEHVPIGSRLGKEITDHMTGKIVGKFAVYKDSKLRWQISKSL